ncbi:unnamed protein product, partial [Ixodes hexagonus]
MASDSSPTQDGRRRLGNRWNSEEAIMDPIRLLQELEREAHEKRRGKRAQAAAESAEDATAAKLSNGPYTLLEDMAANTDKTPLLKDTSMLNGPGGRRKGKGAAARKKPPNVKEKTGVGGRVASTLPVNRHGKNGGKVGKATVKPLDLNSAKPAFEEKKALTPVPEEGKKDEPSSFDFKVQDHPEVLVPEPDLKTVAPSLELPEPTTENKPKEKTSVLSRMRDAAKKINVAPGKLQQTVLNAKLLHSKLTHSKSSQALDSAEHQQSEAAAAQPRPESAQLEFRFSESPDSFLEDSPEKEPIEKTVEDEKTEEDDAAKPPEQEKPKGATWTGTSTNPELALKILNMSRRGDWLGVDALLKHVEKGDLPSDLADEATGFTPLMYAVKDSRVGLADKFIDIGANVNAKAK